MEGPSSITVRLSKELHEKAKEAAHDSRQSLNQFCISRIEAGIAAVAAAKQARSGRAAPPYKSKSAK